MSTSYPISIWSSITANQKAPACPHLCAQSYGYISPLADETVVFYLELGATDPLVRDIRASCYWSSSFYQVAWSEKFAAFVQQLRHASHRAKCKRYILEDAQMCAP